MSQLRRVAGVDLTRIMDDDLAGLTGDERSSPPRATPSASAWTSAGDTGHGDGAEDVAKVRFADLGALAA